MSENLEKVKRRVTTMEQAIVLLKNMITKDDERIDMAAKRIEQPQSVVDIVVEGKAKFCHKLANIFAKLATFEDAQTTTQEALARLTSAQAETDRRLNELTDRLRRGDEGCDGH